MKTQTIRTAAAALALSLGSGLSFGALAAGTPVIMQVAQAEATDIGTAIAAYQAAQANLEAAKAAGSDLTEAQNAVDATTAQLGQMCQMLGQPDIAACIAAVTAVPTDQPVEQPVVEQPVVEQPAVDAAQPPAAVEQPAAEPAPAAPEAPVVEQPVVEQPAEPAAPTVEEPAQPAPVVVDAPPNSNTLAPPDPLLAAVSRYETLNAALANAVAQGGDTVAALADVTAAQNDVGTLCLQLGQTDISTCLAQFGLQLSPIVAISASTDQPQPAESDAAPVADTQPTAPAPEATPADAAPAEAPAVEAAPAEATPVEAPAAEEPAVEVNPAGTPIPRELSLAVASYEQANMLLGNSVVGTPEATAAQADIDASMVDLQSICAQSGQPDLTACLAAFGVALSPTAVALQEAQKPTAAETIPAEEVAPILDSQKEAQLAGEVPAPAPTEADRLPPPDSNTAAQAGAVPETIPSIEATAGTALAAPPPPVQPHEAQVVDQSGPRIVIQFNNQLIINNHSETRLEYGAVDRYVEQLPHGRTRETIFRQDGTKLITVYNRNGDILRRSHIDAYGNETVFSYVQDNYEQDLLNWHDPGEDLPPLWLNIPPQDYVLDAQRTNLNDLTVFFDAPPVEQVKRLYSIDEVKRSARLRDMVRRLEIGNLTFAVGASSISPDQIGALSIVANAMLNLIDKNPAETFLVEGHTDATGPDSKNLILSDQRAETVAITLTEVFGVPPENIAAQGYGERYLKVNTQAAERLNRRVTVRRITTLVAPDASSFSMN